MLVRALQRVALATASYGSNAGVFKIGEGVMESSGGNLDGRVDEVQVFDRAFCLDQVFELFENGRPAGVRIIQWIEVK